MGSYSSQHVSTVVDDPKGSGIADQINADTVVAQIPDKNADYTIIAEITTETVTDTGEIKNVLVTRDSEHSSMGSYSSQHVSTVVDDPIIDTWESSLESSTGQHISETDTLDPIVDTLENSYCYLQAQRDNYDSEDSESDSDEDIEDDDASDHGLDTGLRCKECGKFFAGPYKVSALMQHQVWYQCNGDKGTHFK